MAEAKNVIAVARSSVGNDRRPLGAVVLANAVRLSHAADDDWTRHYQKEMIELVKDIGRFQQSAFQPLPPELKAVSDRQSAYLRSVGREAEAAALDATVAEIEARTPSANERRASPTTSPRRSGVSSHSDPTLTRPSPRRA